MHFLSSHLHHILTAIIARVLLGEKVSLSTIFCMVGVATGITIMVVEGFHSGALLGNIYALGAALGFSIFNSLFT